MKMKWLLRTSVAFGTAGVLCATLAISADADGKKSPGETSRESAESSPKVEEKNRVPLAVARDRAKIMHDVYEATLDVMHHRYFRGERAVVPARAMHDIFAEISYRYQADAEWIAVNARAMSIDHEPDTDFEKKAAQAIESGKKEIEVVEDGYYRRAGAIPLGSGCIGCHEGFSRAASKTPKFAGLVISIPILEEADDAN